MRSFLQHFCLVTLTIVTKSFQHFDLRVFVLPFLFIQLMPQQAFHVAPGEGLDHQLEIFLTQYEQA